MKKVRIDKDIEKIKKYILKDETFSLFTSLKKISEIIRYLDEQHFTDNTMYGILDVFSINFYLFKDDSSPAAIENLWCGFKLYLAIA